MKQLPIEIEQLIHMFAEQLKLKSDIEVKLIIDLANKIFETKSNSCIFNQTLFHSYNPKASN